MSTLDLNELQAPLKDINIFFIYINENPTENQAFAFKKD